MVDIPGQLRRTSGQSEPWFAGPKIYFEIKWTKHKKVFKIMKKNWIITRLLINQSINQTPNQSTNQSINQSISKLINRPFIQLGIKSINQLIDRPLNWVSNQSINRSIKQVDDQFSSDFVLRFDSPCECGKSNCSSWNSGRCWAWQMWFPGWRGEWCSSRECRQSSGALPRLNSPRRRHASPAAPVAVRNVTCR